MKVIINQIKNRKLFWLLGVAILIGSLSVSGATATSNETTSIVKKTGSQGDYFPMQNFRLEIDGVIQEGFKKISGIESETEIIEYKDGDDKEISGIESKTEIKDGDDMIIRKRPGRTKYSNLVLKRGFINDPMFWNWYQKVIKGVAERKSGSIIVLDRAGQEIGRYNFFGAWPTKWKGPVLDTKGDSHMIEEIELAVERIERA